MLSPAFDVNPNPDKGEHVLSIDGADANAIALQVRNAVRGWDQKAKVLGLSRGEIELMCDVIDAER